MEPVPARPGAPQRAAPVLWSRPQGGNAEGLTAEAGGLLDSRDKAKDPRKSFSI